MAPRAPPVLLVGVAQDVGATRDFPSRPCHYAALLAVAGQTWDEKALAALIEKLDQLEPRDSKKCKGRMAQYTGPKWIRGILADPGHLTRFSGVSVLNAVCCD